MTNGIFLQIRLWHYKWLQANRKYQINEKRTLHCGIFYTNANSDICKIYCLRNKILYEK